MKTKTNHPPTPAQHIGPQTRADGASHIGPGPYIKGRAAGVCAQGNRPLVEDENVGGWIPEWARLPNLDRLEEIERGTLTQQSLFGRDDSREAVLDRLCERSDDA